MQPITITASDLAALIGSLGAPTVITKNKTPEGDQNFRPRPRHRGDMLDGIWTGQPSRVIPGDSFAMHFIERRNELWIGDYLGTIEEGNGLFSLIVGNAQHFEITDLDFNNPLQQKLREILKQPGAVIYSYVDPMVNITAANTDTMIESLAGPVFKMSQFKRRLHQQAFRKAVFAQHGMRCIVTKCTVEALLEAAHIHGRNWQDGHNSSMDGIPLRVDIHRAYDQKLITLDDHHRVVYVHPDLIEQYRQYLHL